LGQTAEEDGSTIIRVLEKAHIVLIGLVTFPFAGITLFRFKGYHLSRPKAGTPKVWLVLSCGKDSRPFQKRAIKR
jgi:hypothetical protein